MPSDLPALHRLRERWRALPLARAEELTPLVLELAQQVADANARNQHGRLAQLPQLGAAVVMDQMSVVAYDASEAGLSLVDWEAELERILALTYTGSCFARGMP